MDRTTAAQPQSKSHQHYGLVTAEVYARPLALTTLKLQFNSQTYKVVIYVRCTVTKAAPHLDNKLCMLPPTDRTTKQRLLSGNFFLPRCRFSIFFKLFLSGIDNNLESPTLITNNQKYMQKLDLSGFPLINAPIYSSFDSGIFSDCVVIK